MHKTFPVLFSFPSVSSDQLGGRAAENGTSDGGVLTGRDLKYMKTFHTFFWCFSNHPGAANSWRYLPMEHSQSSHVYLLRFRWQIHCGWYQCATYDQTHALWPPPFKPEGAFKKKTENKRKQKHWPNVLTFHRQVKDFLSDTSGKCTPTYMVPRKTLWPKLHAALKLKLDIIHSASSVKTNGKSRETQI